MRSTLESDEFNPVAASITLASPCLVAPQFVSAAVLISVE